MECPTCSFANSEGSRFCEDCGARLDSLCPKCGASWRDKQKFCRECGCDLTASHAAPQRLVPISSKLDRRPQVADDGERKKITVLFADIADSTAIIENLDPEAAAGLLQPLLDAMKRSVHRYGGTVNKIQGDGIMALFGAPVAMEDHAVMGCYAALTMQAAASEMKEAALKLRIGLHSGEVFVRSMGNDLSIDYDAIGPTVHLASRMEQMARPGTIYLTDQTYRFERAWWALPASKA